DDGADAKRTLHQARFGKPRVEVVSEHVGIEQSSELEPPVPDHVAHVVQGPDSESIFVGDEAERASAGTLQAPRQQHAEALMGEPPLERIADEITSIAARESLDQDFVRTGDDPDKSLPRAS